MKKGETRARGTATELCAPVLKTTPSGIPERSVKATAVLRGSMAGTANMRQSTTTTRTAVSAKSAAQTVRRMRKGFPQLKCFSAAALKGAAVRGRLGLAAIGILAVFFG